MTGACPFVGHGIFSKYLVGGWGRLGCAIERRAEACQRGALKRTLRGDGKLDWTVSQGSR